MVIFIPYSSSKCRTTPNAMERPILKYMTYMTEGQSPKARHPEFILYIASFQFFRALHRAELARSDLHLHFQLEKHQNCGNHVSSLAPRFDPAASETSQTYATSEAFQPFTTLDLDPIQNKTCQLLENQHDFDFSLLHFIVILACVSNKSFSVLADVHLFSNISFQNKTCQLLESRHDFDFSLLRFICSQAIFEHRSCSVLAEVQTFSATFQRLTHFPQMWGI